MTDAEFVRAPREWPRWPLLPLKRYVDSQLELGFMVADEELTVYHGSFMNVADGVKTVGQLIAGRTVSKYETVEALLRDWRID